MWEVWGTLWDSISSFPLAAAGGKTSNSRKIKELLSINGDD
jgi:hypothetical protein